jgi:multisubunit Na+/H+ antiporter MnhE subunit
MSNIFNLILFLLVFWILLIFLNDCFKPLYLIAGIFFSVFISCFSYYFGLVKKNSELLFLSLGFYRHFLGIYFANFFSSLNLIIDLAIGNKKLKPVVYEIKKNNNKNFDHSLLIATINTTDGLFYLSADNKKMNIYAINESFFHKFDFEENYYSLSRVNDDQLIWK